MIQTNLPISQLISKMKNCSSLFRIRLSNTLFLFFKIIIPQIVFIYILCYGKTQYKEQTTNQQKVKGIYTDLTLLCEHLKRDIKQIEYNLTSISILSSAILETSEKVELNQLEPSFMYSQLFKEMVLEIPQNQTDVRLHDEFVKYCRDKYADNNVTLKVIDEFYRDY